MTENHNPLEGLLAGVARQQAKQHMVRTYVQGITLCMEQEAVNLEAAITSLRTVIDADNAFDREQIAQTGQVDAAKLAEAEEMLAEAFREAVVQARKIVSEAHRLARLDDHGSATPVPYNEAEHMKARAASLDTVQAFQQFFGGGQA